MKKLVSFLAMIVLSACQESLENRCAREAESFTKKNWPAKLSETVTVDSMVFHQATLTIQYYYRLTGMADDSTLVDTETWRNQLLSDLKNATSMKPYLDANYNVQYIYHSESHPNQVLFDALFTPDDYNKVP